MTAGPVTVRVVLPDGDELEAGTLRFSAGRGHETAVFAYASSYLADPRAYSLDPALPLTSGVHATGPGQRLFGAMGDSAPDRWGQGLLARAERRAAVGEGRPSRALLDSDLLLGVHDDLRQGAIRYTSASGDYVAGTERGVPRPVDLPHLLALTDRLVRDPATDADLRDLVDAGSSLGGARPKAAVRTTSGVLRIAKFPKVVADEWDVPAWEKVTLDLAAAAGITVPRSDLVRVLDRNVLLIDRFDRVGERRVGYLSAMSLLELDGRTDGLSFAELAEEAGAVAARPDADLHELWRRAVFGLMVSNTDNHLRNHGFLRERSGWSISPAFDLNPNPDAARFATSVGPGGGDDMETALDVADGFSLTRPRALAIMGDVLAGVEQWRVVAARLGIEAAQIAVMAPAFESQRTGQARALSRALR
ncbi:MAG: type II toxin-antitoxin system HipA family toxin [Actinobacteria bacterium]|nr:type II toxin-antitoxin system HipA family toxin [Actinomycetota bacterium]